MAGGYGATAIHHQLNASGFYSDPHHPVSLDTIKRRVREYKVSDQSGAWSAIDAGSDEARLVLDVAVEVYRVSGGRDWLTNDLAKLVAKVRGIAPSAPLLWAHGLARAYQVSKARKLDTRGLDLTLSMGPWKDSESALAWAAALRETLSSDSDWPGGATGIMTLIALLPRPSWVDEAPMWGAIYWTRVIGIRDHRTFTVRADDSLHADSNLTAEPANDPVQSETVQDENLH